MRRISRTRFAAAAGISALIVAAAACGSAPASRTTAVRPAAAHGGGRSATATETSSNPLVCPQSTYPKSPTDQTPYAIAFKADIVGGTVNSGYNEDTGRLKKGQIYTPWQLQVSNIVGQACGLLQLPSLQIVVQPSGVVIDGNLAHIAIVIAPFGTQFALQDFDLKVQILGALAPAITGVLSTGQINAEAKNVGAHAVLSTKKTAPIYLVCPANVTIPDLTTGTTTVVPAGRGPSSSWTIHGSPVTGPLLGATATVVSNDFALGPFTKTTDKWCGTVQTSPGHFIPTGAFAAVFDNIIGGINAKGKQYNPTTSNPDVYNYGAPPGESQAALSIRLTYVDLPALSPTAASPRLGA